MKFPNFKPLNHTKGYLKNVSNSIINNRVTQGPKCLELENKIKKFLNCKYAILTTSGTSALMMAAIASDINPQDKVICQNLAWVAATNPFLIMGASLSTVDTLVDSVSVDIDLLEKKITKLKPKVLILVHLNGQISSSKKINYLKKKYKLFIIEDSAQAFLSKPIKKNSVNFDIGCYSLSFAKPIHMVYGGVCCTNDKRIAKKLNAIRSNGVFPENSFTNLSTIRGLNFKPSDMYAAVGLENFKSIKHRSANLIKLYNCYENNLKNDKIHLPKLKKGSVPNFAEILVKDKNDFFLFCSKHNIGVTNGMNCLSESNNFKYNKKELINSLRFSKRVVRLPFGAGYKVNEIQKICKILNFYE